MSIIDSNFGYKSRHKVHFNLKKANGYFEFWTGYSSSVLLGGTNHHIITKFGSENDLISMLTAVNIAKTGIEHGFSNELGKYIFIKPTPDGYTITVEGDSSSGKLENDELNKLELIVRDLLMKLGVSYSILDKQVRRTN